MLDKLVRIVKIGILLLFLQFHQNATKKRLYIPKNDQVSLKNVSQNPVF